MELHALQLEVLSLERVQIDSLADHVAPEHGGRFAVDVEVPAETVDDFLREKRDLALVVVLVIEEAVALNPLTRHATHLRHFQRRVVAGRLAVVAEEVVAGRNVQMQDSQRGLEHLEK